jgi:anti-anti-sigma regulatory factor
MTPTSITTSQVRGQVPVTVLQPHGEVDAANYRDLIAAAQAAYADGARYMLLDLSDVPFMSSSGLVALQSIAALMRGDTMPDSEHGWAAFRAIDRDREAGAQTRFKLLDPQPRVSHVLEVTGLDHFLEVWDDLDQAVASFSPPAAG